MTILSWGIIFTYSIINSGNVLYGIIALFGLCLAHFGTNLLDDYFDYKSLIKQVNFDKKEYLKNSQKTKCRYLINGIIKERDLIIIFSTFFALASLIGLFLYIKCGTAVIYYMLIAAILILLYPFASKICLSEIFVALVYGPTLFGGIYYVMCNSFSKEVFMLSIPSMIMTVVLLYIHTVMDYEFDKHENKKTLANSFDTQLKSLIILRILIILAYVSIPFLCIFDISDWQVFFTYLTIPLANDLFQSMTKYAQNPNEVPEHKWYHFPMENMERLTNNGESAFMIRMYQARNLMMYFSLLLILAIILSLAI